MCMYVADNIVSNFYFVFKSVFEQLLSWAHWLIKYLVGIVSIQLYAENVYM